MLAINTKIVNVLEYWVYRRRNIGMSGYWGVRIVGSLETNFNGLNIGCLNIGLSEYWVYPQFIY